MLSFPVLELQVAALIQQAVRAPYGRGEETLLDLSARKVWQLPANHVRTGGKSWAASFDTIMAKVAAGLGCERAVVSAELYKLLIYGKRLIGVRSDCLRILHWIITALEVISPCFGGATGIGLVIIPI